VELTFTGGAPELYADDEMTVEGDRVRLTTSDPAATLSKVMPQLPTGALESVEILRPNLEAVYLSLTGRRYEEADKETEHVAAS
jgi:ABC-2 type transport system ATP-binding protein